VLLQKHTSVPKFFNLQCICELDLLDVKIVVYH
jgi:hypothetical protein